MHPLFHPLFLQYVRYFNEHKDYFECHEVLEEYWKEIAPRDKQHPLVGWILLATSMYHWRRGNFRGANRSLKKAIAIFFSNKNSEFLEHINLALLFEKLNNANSQIEHEVSFESFQLNFSDTLLELEIEMPPIQQDDFLLNKHMLRDRSNILAQRQHAKRNK